MYDNVFYHISTCFVFTLQIILCHYFFCFVNKCLLKFWVWTCPFSFLQNTPWGEVNRPALTFLQRLFSHDLLILVAFTTCGNPFFFSIKRIRTGRAVNLTFIDEVNPVTYSQIICLLIRLLSFKASESSRQKLEMQSHPGTLSGCVSISLMSVGITVSSNLPAQCE